MKAHYSNVARRTEWQLLAWTQQGVFDHHVAYSNSKLWIVAVCLSKLCKNSRDTE